MRAADPTTDGRLARGDRTRTAVLDTALALATELGLDGLSLAQLADRLGVSKSGLFAHWRSKEELQLATIEWAQERFVDDVVRPALVHPPGVRRLCALLTMRLDYMLRQALPGGCFFTNAQFEFDARPGPIRDRLAVALHDWLALVERLTREAVDAGDLVATLDARQLAFELNAVAVAAVCQSRLLPASGAPERARRASLDRVRTACTDPRLLAEPADEPLDQDARDAGQPADDPLGKGAPGGEHRNRRQHDGRPPRRRPGPAGTPEGIGEGR